MIQTSNANKFRKIITVDLNREPQSVNDLGTITEFRSDKNWFFDGLLNPQLSIELNLLLLDNLAEEEGFEPSIGFILCRISSAVHSTTLPLFLHSFCHGITIPN